MSDDTCTPLNRIYDSLALSPPVADTRSPVLMILTGLPGTGKTHLAHALCELVPITLVGSDALRAMMFAAPVYSPRENGEVYRVADLILCRLLAERRDVVYDAVNLSERRRAALRALAREAGARPLTVLTTAPEHVVWLRLAHRRDSPTALGDSLATWEVYRRLAARAGRVAHPHIVINTGEDLGPALAQILAWIEPDTGNISVGIWPF